MKQHQKNAGVFKEPPLQTQEFIRKDPRTGLDVPVTRYRRGILSVETYHYTAENIMAMQQPSPRELLDSLRDHLRKALENLGLPTDQARVWLCDKGGEWRPRKEDDLEIQVGQGYSLWTKRVKDLTQPLSRGLLAGELLESLNCLLDRPGIDEHLWHICQVMEDYHSYQVGGNISRLAASGLASQKARATGPLARKRRTAETRQIIWKCVQTFWDKHPAYRGDATNTASRIADLVNAELRELGLLRQPDGRLSNKTISDHIRANSRGQLLRTG